MHTNFVNESGRKSRDEQIGDSTFLLNKGLFTIIVNIYLFSTESRPTNLAGGGG